MDEAKVKSKRGRSAVNKGRQGEREAGKQLDRLIGGDWRRSLVQSRAGNEDADIISDEWPDLFVEVKRGKRTSPNAALQQACEASSGSGRLPLALTRADGSQWLLTLKADDLPGLVRLIAASDLF